MAKIAINIATGSLQKDEIIVGIDLGTTNSLVAIIHPETKMPVALKEHNTSSLVPSVIYFDDQGNIEVGETAKSHLESHPERTIFSAKRLMGKSYEDVKNNESSFSYKIINDNTDSLVKVQLGNKFYSPVELSSFILKELKKRAEHILKTRINKAVITVPAYFNDTQRQATRDAGKLAGLDVLRIINEPTAASLAYGIGHNNTHSSKNEIIAVYDLGGGTFDISILRLNDGIFEVLSTNGDTYLGGDDIDHLIVSHWCEKIGITTEQLSNDKSLNQTFRLKAETAKKYLSNASVFEDIIDNHPLVLTKEELEVLIAPLISKTIKCCELSLKDAGIKKSEITSIIMVGGSTRIPYIKHSVSNYFARPVNDKVNPDEVVALGAAIQADILAGNNKELLLLDVTPLSLGIETAGELMDVLVPRNSKIPTTASRQYTTQVDGQSSMRITVFQGERDMVKDNRKLATLNLSNIPAMPAGLPKVEIQFLINADGILTVTAKELRSGVSQQIEVKPQYGLTDSEVEQMLLDSITHAKDDIALRALTEARTEGEQLLKTTEKFLEKNTTGLTQDELLNTAASMQSLQMAITMEDKNLIHQKIEELNNISRPYAERIMDQAIGKAMTGKKI
jgi:molecular chaperone HscA